MIAGPRPPRQVIALEMAPPANAPEAHGAPPVVSPPHVSEAAHSVMTTDLDVGAAGPRSTRPSCGW
ncbi:Hypothetical protein CAP_1913 [Chondromyces apiculatus DSM 436]|uniref:Uncharacterized protein n=1 Tax=Chondromyces apiculatus DSM 436 TaxID=1192034 RepID=A0A017TAS2_9BACT|nr:Hypothetical protein CAP_1913 [Chondromyces apiculatus DSM 436]